jgi:hypothetical protein
MQSPSKESFWKPYILYRPAPQVKVSQANRKQSFLTAFVPPSHDLQSKKAARGAGPLKKKFGPNSRAYFGGWVAAELFLPPLW